MKKLTKEYIDNLCFIVTANVHDEPYQSTRVGVILSIYNITNVSIESVELNRLKDYKNKAVKDIVLGSEDKDFIRREVAFSNKNIFNFREQCKKLANTDSQIEPLLEMAQRLGKII